MNWKKIAASEGYKSLKQAYVRDVQRAQKQVRRGVRPMRDKEEFRRYFKKAIGFAMKYSNKWDIPISEVLNHWEAVRDRNSWINFYQVSTVSRNKPKSVR